jgi:hypothetical protein
MRKDVVTKSSVVAAFSVSLPTSPSFENKSANLSGGEEVENRQEAKKVKLEN